MKHLRYRAHAREAVNQDGKPTTDIIEPLVVVRRLLASDRVDHWRTAQTADAIISKMVEANTKAHARSKERYGDVHEIPSGEELDIFLQHLDMGTIALTNEEWDLLSSVVDDAGVASKFTRYPGACFGSVELRHYVPIFLDLSTAGPYPKDPPEIPNGKDTGRM